MKRISSLWIGAPSVLILTIILSYVIPLKDYILSWIIWFLMVIIIGILCAIIDMKRDEEHIKTWRDDI